MDSPDHTLHPAGRPRRGVTADLLCIGLLIILIITAWCLSAGRLGSSFWTTPTAYLSTEKSDVMFTLAWTRAAADGHFVPLAQKTVPELGAPYQASWTDWPITEEILTWGMGLLGRAFGIVGALHISLILGHVLAGLTMYLVARWSGCLRKWAFVAALAFGLAPFAFSQSPHHIVVVFYWHVPLFLLVWKWTGTSPGLVPFSGKFWFALAVGFVAGLQNVYYTNILCQLTFLGALIAFVRNRSLPALLSALGVIASAALAFALMNLDTWTYIAANGPNPGALVREYKWLEIYGLKLVDLIIPPSAHISPLLSAFGTLHRMSAPLQDEGSYLGILGIAALVFLIASTAIALIRHHKDAIPPEAWQVAWIVIVFTTGGLNAIAGTFGFTMFRTGCRYSIVILAIVLLFAARRLSAAAPLRSRLLTGLIVFALSVIVLWDQVPRPPAPAETAQIARQIAADRTFAAAVETALPKGTMVFQIPVMDFPEAPAPGIPPYDHFRPYLFSRDLRFSFGTMKGRPREQWQAALSTVPFDQAVDEIHKRGFAAISINKNGFPDKAAGLIAALAKMGHTQIIESPAGDLVCVVFAAK